jgi:hypothetical protein
LSSDVDEDFDEELAKQQWTWKRGKATVDVEAEAEVVEEILAEEEQEEQEE